MNPAALLIAASLALAPDAASPSPTASQQVHTIDRVILVVDHTPLLEEQKASQAEKLGRFVREDTTAALQEQHGIDVVEDEDAVAIVVRLAWVDYEESIYRLDIGVRRPGGRDEVVDTWTIDFANYSQLTGSVVERLPAALERVREPVAEPVVEPEPESAASAVAPEATDGDDSPSASDDRKPAVLGPVGIAGAVVGVAGVVVGAVALDAALSEPSRNTDPSDEQGVTGRRPSPGAYAWTATGFGLAAVGITMLVVDLTVLRKRRARAVSVVPSLGPSTAGLQLTTRF